MSDKAQPRIYLVIRVLSGPDAGRTIEISSGQVAYFGRSPTMEKTGTIDRVPLEPQPEQIDRVEAFLGGRAPTRQDPEQTSPGMRPRLEDFDRIADVKLLDGTVSRVHALIFVDQDRAGVVDLASTNGTVVNGRKVSASAIEAGDSLELGTVRLEVVGLG